MKIHEETWVAEWPSDEALPKWRVQRAGEPVESADYVCRLTMTGNLDLEARRARFIAAAPKMARALAGPKGTGHNWFDPQALVHRCTFCTAFAPAHGEECEIGIALREAGVLK